MSLRCRRWLVCKTDVCLSSDQVLPFLVQAFMGNRWDSSRATVCFGWLELRGSSASALIDRYWGKAMPIYWITCRKGREETAMATVEVVDVEKSVGSSAARRKRVDIAEEQMVFVGRPRAKECKRCDGSGEYLRRTSGLGTRFSPRDQAQQARLDLTRRIDVGGENPISHSVGHATVSDEELSDLLPTPDVTATSWPDPVGSLTTKTLSWRYSGLNERVPEFRIASFIRQTIASERVR